MGAELLQKMTGSSPHCGDEPFDGLVHLQEPPEDQWRLESAIFDRLQPMAFGHTPGSTGHVFDYVEPGERVVILHPGVEFDILQLARSITPEFYGGTWNKGIPALRCGQSKRGVVLYRDGIDAAVILAGISKRDWMKVVGSLDTGSSDSYYFKSGPVSAEEAAGVKTEAQYCSRYGSILLRRIGVLFALPHIGIDVYVRTPGLVVEVVQHEQRARAMHGFIQALECAGLVLERQSISASEIALTFRHAAEVEPLFVRLAYYPFSDLGLATI